MKKLLFALAFLLAWPAAAQPLRIQDYNTIAWAVYTGDNALGTKWTLHTEAQLRRVKLGADPQQFLVQAGLGYQLLPRLRAGRGIRLPQHFALWYPPAGGGRGVS